eukprot:GILJ01025033.1.p1 GENE.GILJ01025033.1~~GILJ01025033.1.p1  ORF type:complete len:436 (+),score=38.18 GILJ01025033.1:99-1310(+)
MPEWDRWLDALSKRGWCESATKGFYSSTASIVVQSSSLATFLWLWGRYPQLFSDSYSPPLLHVCLEAIRCGRQDIYNVMFQNIEKSPDNINMLITQAIERHDEFGWTVIESAHHLNQSDAGRFEREHIFKALQHKNYIFLDRMGVVKGSLRHSFYCSPSQEDLDDEQLSWLEENEREEERALRDQTTIGFRFETGYKIERHIKSEILKRTSPPHSRLQWLLAHAQNVNIGFAFLRTSQPDWSTMELLNEKKVIAHKDYVEIIARQVTCFDHYQHLIKGDQQWTWEDHQTCFDFIVGRGGLAELETGIQENYRTEFRPFVSWLYSIMCHNFRPPPSDVVNRCKCQIQQQPLHLNAQHTLIRPPRWSSTGIHAESANEYLKWVLDNLDPSTFAVQEIKNLFDIFI